MENKELFKSMFDEYEKYNAKFKAKTYKDAAEDFCGKYKGMFIEMLNEIESAECAADEVENEELSGGLQGETADKIEEIATEFVTESERIIKKNNKQPGSRKMLMYNMYTVMYIFPCILDTNKKYAKDLLDSIVKKWNKTFRNTNVQYSDYETIDAGFKRKLCYITTAVCEHMGYEDDCEELTLLRKFRDDYMMNTGDGERMVNEYYECAPGIVGAINTMADSDRIYRGMYDKYIRPCVEMIKCEKLEDCLEHYRLMVCEWGANVYAESSACR